MAEHNYKREAENEILEAVFLICLNWKHWFRMRSVA